MLSNLDFSCTFRRSDDQLFGLSFGPPHSAYPGTRQHCPPSRHPLFSPESLGQEAPLLTRAVQHVAVDLFGSHPNNLSTLSRRTYFLPTTFCVPALYSRQNAEQVQPCLLRLVQVSTRFVPHMWLPLQLWVSSKTSLLCCHLRQTRSKRPSG